MNKYLNNIHPHDLSLSFLNKNIDQQKMFLKKVKRLKMMVFTQSQNLQLNRSF